MDVRLNSSILLMLIFWAKAMEVSYATTLQPTEVQNQTLVQNETFSHFQSNISENHENFTNDVDALFEDYWQYYLRDNPEFATSVGDHRYNDKLNNYSLESYEQRKLATMQFLDKANILFLKVEKNSPSEDNLRLFIKDLQCDLGENNIRRYLFPVSFLDGPYTNLQFLLKYTPLKSFQDYQNLILRYLAFPEQVSEVIELMSEGVRSNMTQHERSLRNIQEQMALFQVIPEESVFYEPFKNISDALSMEEKEELQRNASIVIADHVLPSIKKLADYIDQEYSNHLRPEIGVSSLPNGSEFYQQSLNFHLTAEATPEEVHSMGLKEVQRIASEMDKVIELWNFTCSREKFSDWLRSRPELFFSTEEEALNAYKDVMFNTIEEKLPLLFKKIPKMKLTIEKVPKEMANGSKAFYLQGSLDGSTPGIFYLDTNNVKDLAKYEVVTLSLHEGLPGHHLQISYTMEQEGIPKFRKHGAYPMNTAFIEGWALYSEFLGYDLGLYNDSYALYGHLSEEMFRACRLVVDTGMHALGWTRQQAIDYMMAYSASTLGNIEIEVDRYITWPGQACSYKYGEIKIKELRNKAKSDLGCLFDIREFHDIILRSNGPMDFVEQQVDHFIAKWKSKLVD